MPSWKAKVKMYSSNRGVQAISVSNYFTKESIRLHLLLTRSSVRFSVTLMIFIQKGGIMKIALLFVLNKNHFARDLLPMLKNNLGTYLLNSQL